MCIVHVRAFVREHQSLTPHLINAGLPQLQTHARTKIAARAHRDSHIAGTPASILSNHRTRQNLGNQCIESSSSEYPIEAHPQETGG